MCIGFFDKLKSKSYFIALVHVLNSGPFIQVYIKIVAPQKRASIQISQPLIQPIILSKFHWIACA